MRSYIRHLKLEKIWQISVCVYCLVDIVANLFNLSNNGVVVIALVKPVSYGLHNPCCDWATGTGEGKSLLSHGGLQREQ